MHVRVSRWRGSITTGLVCGVGAAGLVLVLVGVQAATAAGHHAAYAKAAGTQRMASLNGANEVPGPGDPNGRGHATVTLRPAMHRVCVDATWSRIGRPIGAHIHQGAAGVSGPVKVTLSSAVTGGSHCKGGVPSDLIRRIKKHPGNFYFNIHTNIYQGGAIRGQLHR